MPLFFRMVMLQIMEYLRGQQYVISDKAPRNKSALIFINNFGKNQHKSIN